MEQIINTKNINIKGNNPEIAVDYPEDEKYNLISDSIVLIQEVIKVDIDIISLIYKCHITNGEPNLIL